MKLLGSHPLDDAEANTLIAQALSHLQHQRQHAAIRALESAALCASPPQLPELYDTLCTLYVGTLQYSKLITLVGSTETFTPPLALGALVLERNRRQSLTAPQTLPSFKSLLSTLVDFIGSARYSFDELCMICSLWAQIGAATSAVALLNALMGALPPATELDEELVTAVLIAALDRKLKREALALAEKLAGLSPAWQIRAQRYRLLILQDSATAWAPEQDKVVDFLNAQTRELYRVR